MKKRLRVGILFGGRSGEHAISLESAASVMQAIDQKKYEIVPIGITPEGRWVLGSLDLKAFPAQARAAVINTGNPVIASADPMGPKLIPLNSLSRTKTSSVPQLDIVFPVLHGTFGEDGTIQGLLELAGIPYVGAGVLGSAAGMDKDVMKKLFAAAGLPIVRHVTVLRSHWINDPRKVTREVEDKLKYPVFVKPANLGSSVGISKVRDRKTLGAAIEMAAGYDRKVVIEQGV